MRMPCRASPSSLLWVLGLAVLVAAPVFTVPTFVSSAATPVAAGSVLHDPTPPTSRATAPALPAPTLAQRTAPGLAERIAGIVRPGSAPLAAPAPCSALPEPFGGAAALPSGCYGHDTAILGFYSDRVGSGSNITWSFTLPVDGGAAQNQSSLYEAAWFGLPLASPTSWTGVCYLEVQLFPDTAWTAPYQRTNSWAVAEVGWQIDPVSGHEDACTAAPVYADGSGAPLDLAGGDRIALALRGTAGSGLGENVTLVDVTSGISASFTAQNSSTGQPLPPLESRSTTSPSVPWSAAGFPAAAMGFEVGRGVSSPSNNSYGGCDPGPPPATATDPAVPCDSYDPSSWVNDTLAPWRIGVPTFSGPAGDAVPSQVEFASSVGGGAVLPTASNGTCTARLGSAFCSYPWFSYSCAAQAFEFGATDFAGVSTDFGKYLQYNSNLSTSALGSGQYLPYGSGIPSCGSPSGSVTVDLSGNGSVSALGAPVANGTTVSGLGAGAYAFAAVPANGSAFLGWSVTGAASVSAGSDPTTTLLLEGNATLTAEFGPGGSTVPFDVAASSGSGGVALVPLNAPDPTNQTVTLASGGTASLAPGLYVLAAYPSPGQLFESWSVSGPASLSAPAGSPAWLDLEGGATAVHLEVRFTPSVAPVEVRFGGQGNGSVVFNGSAAPFSNATRSSEALLNVTPGTYHLVANASPGWSFVGWSVSPSGILTDRRAVSNVTIGPGPASLFAVFAAVVEFDASPVGGGRIAVAQAPPVGNATEVALVPGNYTLDAVPFAGYALSRWSVSDPAALWVFRPGTPHTRLQVNGTGVVSAEYAPQSLENVTFVTSPAGGGSIQFNQIDLYSGTVTNASVTNTTYTARPLPAYGYRFVRWNLTGPVNLSGGLLTVHGSGGVVRAEFVQRLFPVTFTLSPPGLVQVTLDGNPVANGQTLVLLHGSYALAATLAPNTTFSGWSTALALTNVSASGLNATLELRGPGSVAALAVPFVLAALSVDRPAVDVGLPVNFAVVVNGTGPFHYAYLGLPVGCTSADLASLRCVPAAAGPYRVSVLVTAPTGASLTSTPLLLVVHPLPSISTFTAGPSPLDVGQSLTLLVSVFGGTGPFLFAYSNLPSGCTSANVSVLTCRPTQAGTSRVSASVSDAFGQVGWANRTVVVNPALSRPSLAPSPATVTLGVATEFVASAGGGTSPYAYRYTGTVPGCGFANSATLNCTATASGTFPVTVVISDATGANVTAQGVLTVNPVPTVASFSASPRTLPLGEVVTFVVSVSGGTGPFNYTYSGLPPGCAPSFNATFDCAPLSSGVFEVTVHVSDAFGVGTSASTNVSVSAVGLGPQSPASHLDPLWILAAGLIALDAAAAIFVYYLWRPRRRAPGAAPPTVRRP